MKIVSYVVRRIVLASILVSLLGGCAMYGTTRAYYNPGGAVYYPPPGPVYASPAAPVYVDPWYAGPPVFLNFGFRSYSGRHPHRGHRDWHGGGRRGGDGWHGGGRRGDPGYRHGRGGHYRGR